MLSLSSYGFEMKVDQLTKQWLSLEKSSTQLQQNWQQEQQQLQLRIKLLQHQNSTLQASIKSANNKQGMIEKQREDILTKQTIIEQNIANFRTSLPSLVDLLQQLSSGLPPYLSAQVTEEFKQIAQQKELTGKYQAISSMIKQITKSSQLVQVKQSVIELNNEKILTQQLYFGNDQAWFITQDNSRSGLGFRLNNQWVWSEAAEYSEVIRQAINSSQNQMPGPLLNLPIRLEGSL
jgi:chromosome segregation ATPase